MSVGQETKQHIIQTAGHLFRWYGFEAVSIATIIKECNTTKGALYHHFPNGKEELLLAAIQYTGKIMLQDTRNLLSESADPIKILSSHLNHIASQVELNREIDGVPIGNIAGEMAIKNNEIRLACDQVFKSWQQLIKDKFIDCGMQEEDASNLAITLNALFEGGILLSITSASGDPLRAIAKQIPYLVAPKSNLLRE
ncbi:TetR/AcrR family transcriptional regulator [Psychrobacillus sp. FSL K6-2684]|uniref:TetR/AcrR family transcriptional regulator n=1 Tax=Psychrobacillus faecigallinarum TaxID=2762235 RepID=A0ABR8RE63_9BACI|nr:TetR/AcrR family transcriptional regulator [Psychrobacillus faecigallinarum]MBD7946030.1 TetR/AcrR family transcriptional regulator [Psychrobacillus faecigallinarum]